MQQDTPLAGIRVVEHAAGVAGAWAGRLLAAMGAEVIMVEPPTLCPLRKEAPLFANGESALFEYVAAGKRSVVCDLETAVGRDVLAALLDTAQILIDDTPLQQRPQWGLDREGVAARHPDLVHLSVLPFGASGPKAGWTASEINLIHAGGEGYLLPNGLSAHLFPDRPPLKIAGHFAELQGGVAAALSALSALWFGTGQFVDASVQDANVAVGAFALQRYGDGSIEHRHTRSFRYGGVIECRDGYVELLTLEERQWQGLVHLMDDPEWARDEELNDPVTRSERGDAINAAIRAWAREHDVEELVARAQKLGVPMARYNTPEQILTGGHETARGTFQDVDVPGVGEVKIQAAPFRFSEAPLALSAAAPAPGADQDLVTSGAAAASRAGAAARTATA
ncbi:crotonobetainyl-CoA:carnitine CoA-transferase CaiB-like acyl-CoA transferase [Rhodobium orientis]|uniref:CoA transferase n=1 Tax=Rhodobium orientis TaxID=34017 RepID=A0A327JKK5_9HYPH|nr:CoA transferase [Rhodobium orientis]MBB4303239.1 crotonobetainyl-CoA:carnitine CoA-transferase CaiB-like acyl-CoA transferase [Rhodobium orientis]MBK5951661.1 CoA transferase [Rhodobium orientis]RAI25864.1 CoA transferase [Rhodobium orientis]